MHKRNGGLFAVLIATTVWTPAWGQSATEATLDEYFGIVESLGATVVVAEKSSTSTTTLWRDVVVSFQDPKDDRDVKLSWTLPSVEATVRGGGIGLELAERSLMEVSGLGESPDALTVELVMTGQDILINRDGADTQTTYSIGETQIRALPNALFTLDATLLGAAGIYMFEDGEIANVSGSQTVDNMSMAYGFTDPDTNTGGMKSDSSVSDMRITFNYDHFDPETAQEFLTGARNAQFSYSYGQTDATATFDIDGQSGSIVTSVASANGEVSAQDGRILLSGGATDVAYDFGVPMMPPVSFSADIMNLMMSGQMGKLGEVTPADVLLEFGGITLADNLWAIFDPTAKLSRDPMDLKLDLGALLKWKISGPDQFNDNSPPADVTRVDLRDLTLRAAGAQILGEGGVDIKMQGMNPVPTGKLAFDIKGAMALLNTLTEMGIVQPQQAMMARMFSQSMARPGPDGDDHLITEVEAKADGAVLVNGTRMR